MPEGTNLYFTNARTVAATLTGYSVGTNTALAATDTVNGAFGKVQAQISAIGAPAVTSRSVDYTFVLADANTRSLHPSADTAVRTWTLPANASVAFPVGTRLWFNNQNSAGAVTVAITTDSLRGTDGVAGSKVIAANGRAEAVKLTATEWQIWGNGLTNAATNIIVNGTFTGGAGTQWTFNVAGNFTGDKANFDGTASQTLNYNPAVSLTNGVAYTLTFTMSGYTSGFVNAQFLGGTTVGLTTRASNGTFTESFTAGGNTSFRFAGNAGTPTFSIDDVILTQP